MKSDEYNLLTGLRREEGPVEAPVLGELELDVMERLWQSEGLTAQQVLDGLAGHRITLSTVQSTLERLVRKQLLVRAKQGRAFTYSPCIEREQLIGLMMQALAARLANDRLTPMVSGFCEFVEKRRRGTRAERLAGLLRRFLGKEQDR